MAGLKKLYCRFRYGKPLVLVSGLPRSGTSMVMQMLRAGGLEAGTDNIRQTDEDNPRGYYELERVKELDRGGNKEWLKEYRGKVVKIISYLLRDLSLENNYRVVFIERDLDEILLSQKKMLRRRGEDEEDVEDGKIKKNYRNHLLQVRYFLRNTPNFETLTVNYGDVQKQPEPEARRINGFLGGRLDTDAMAAAVDRTLYRNRKDAS